MATDTAPPSPTRTSRRNYWQLPTFVLGVTAAVAAWVYFPPPPPDPAAVFARDLSRLREALDRRPADLTTVEALAPAVAADAGRFPQHTTTARFLAGSGLLALAEADPANAGRWADAAKLLAAVEPASLPDADQKRLAFRRAKADAAVGSGDPKALVAALAVAPPGEEADGERHRLLAETYRRADPPDWKRYCTEMKAYLGGPSRMPPAALAEYRLQLADAYLTLNDPANATTWLKEIGPTAPATVQARAKVTLGKLAAADGNWAEAAKQYEAALSGRGLPADEVGAVRYQAGMAHVRLGKPAAAAPHFEQARQDAGPAAPAAALRLAEVALRDPAQKGARGKAAELLAAVAAAAKPGESLLRPHLTAAEVQAAFEEAIQVMQAEADFAGAVAVADLFARVAAPDRARERRADVTAAWAAALQKAGGKAAEAVARFKAAADDYAALAATHPTPTGRGDLLRRAASCLRLAGDDQGVVAVADRIATIPGLPDEIIAAAWVDKGEALLAGHRFPEAVTALQQAMTKPGAAATQARVKLALAHLEQAKARTPEGQKEAAGLRDLGQKLLAQVANATADGPAERDAQQQALFELGKLLLQQANVPDAEARFRQLVQTHPTGPLAGQGKLYLGSCLLLLARGDNQDGRPPADADRKLAEALKLFEELAGSPDAFLRAQADIRLANTLLLLKRYDDLPAVCDKLAARYQGKVEELIVLSMLYSAYRLADRAEPAAKTFERMEAVYAKMTPADFSGGAEEYTRDYWQREWFDRLRGTK